MSNRQNVITLESDRVTPGLEKLGIGPGWMISIPDEADAVEETAARILQRLLRLGGVNAPVAPESKAAAERRILLGRECSSPAVRKLGDEGTVRIRDVSPEDDGFHVKGYGGGIAVAGANPRGVLYGAYALEEFIRGGAGGTPDIRKVPWFRRRTNAAAYYFNSTVNLKTDEFTPEKAEYLSRLGVNQYLMADTNYHMSLHETVSSDVFPFIKPPDPDCVRKVKAISAICRAYGIDYYQWVGEPTIPSVLCDDISLFPPEALGTVRRPWGGDANGLERTLCVSSPLVQAHFRDMAGRFVREFPDVKGFCFYNLDVVHWLCTPGLCPRCAQVATDSPQELHNPWETQAALVTLLCDAAHAARPDFRFIFWAAVHYRGEHLRKLIDGAAGYDALACSWNGSDRDVMIPAAAVPDESFALTRAAAEARGIPAYMIHECNRLEAVQPGFPYLSHLADALKKYKAWGVRDLLEFGGPDPALNPVNALAMRELTFDPDLDAEALFGDLAARQFGGASGRLMRGAWTEIKNAMDVWNGYGLHPLSGSQMFLGVGIMAGMPPAILPGVEETYEYNLAIRVLVEPWRAPDYQRFREKQFLTDYERMAAFLAKAERRAARAASRASGSERIGLWLYPGSPEGPGRPTRREYARMNHTVIAMAVRIGAQRAHMIRAARMLQDIGKAEAAGNAAAVRRARREYRALVRRDIRLQRRFLGLLRLMRARRPCLPRAGMAQREIETWIIGTGEKIARLEAYLGGARMRGAAAPENR